MFLNPGHTQTDSDFESGRFQIFNLLTQFLAAPENRFTITVFHQQAKFLPPETHRHVFREMAVKELAQLGQYMIAGNMAEIVVDALEMIDIDNDGPDPLIFRGANKFFTIINQIAFAAHAGETVGSRDPAHVFRLFFQRVKLMLDQQQGAHPGNEDFFDDRLVHKIIAAGVENFHLGAGIIAAGQYQHRQFLLGKVIFCANGVQQIAAGHGALEIEVGNYQIKGQRLLIGFFQRIFNHGQRLFRGTHMGHIQTVLGQNFQEDGRRRAAVLDKQDLPHEAGITLQKALNEFAKGFITI